MTLLDPTYRLACDGRHAYVGEAGAFIGAGVPLLEKDSAGRWRPRPRDVLERLFRIGYDQPVDLDSRMEKLDSVAKALNEGDKSMAAVALIETELTPLPDADAANRMAKAHRLESNPIPHESGDPHKH